MGTMRIRVDSIFTLTLTTQQYAKTQPKFDIFDEQILELEVDLDFDSSTTRLLSTSSCLLMRSLNFFGTKKHR